ncbi:multiple epidermal growth factor-like domains protein 10 [Ostrea edulis]|uniref:multiple epidermal growth factor-like domains protein 10 n=1 Tax=Ostrea edulis TaxID=37623 RepID=UPI0024AFD557|nr:multiple epidermal growth factor-like domains protein 10 [Ostrea edulis]
MIPYMYKQLLILTYIYNGIYNFAQTNSLTKCPAGSKRSGNTCIESCPSGYFGDDCSELCPVRSYGKECGGKCDCLPEACNHVVGCTTFQVSTLHTTVIEEGTNHTTDETEVDDHDCPPFKFTSHQVNTRTIIVLVASIICSVLVYLIIYEFRKYRYACLSYSFPQSSTTTECVYAEINEVNSVVIENEGIIKFSANSNNGKA